MNIDTNLLKTIMAAVLLPSAIACSTGNAQRNEKHYKNAAQTDSSKPIPKPKIVIRDTVLTDTVGQTAIDPNYCPPCGRG